MLIMQNNIMHKLTPPIVCRKSSDACLRQRKKNPENSISQLHLVNRIVKLFAPKPSRFTSIPRSISAIEVWRIWQWHAHTATQTSSSNRFRSALIQRCSLDWSRRRLMPVMSHRNPRHAPRSAVMLAAGIKGSRRWVVTSAATRSFHCFLGALGGQHQPTGCSAHRSCFSKWNRLFGTHVQTVKDDSTESASQRWADPCNGAVSCHSVAGRVGLPQVFGGDSSSGKSLVSSSQLPRASSTQKHTTKWWWLHRCRSSSLSWNLCCIASRHTPWVWQRHQMLCRLDIPPPPKM